MRRFGVRCDGCHEWAPQEPPDSSNMDPARLARAERDGVHIFVISDSGWKSIKGGWICPACLPDFRQGAAVS